MTEHHVDVIVGVGIEIAPTCRGVWGELGVHQCRIRRWHHFPHTALRRRELQREISTLLAHHHCQILPVVIDGKADVGRMIELNCEPVRCGGCAEVYGNIVRVADAVDDRASPTNTGERRDRTGGGIVPPQGVILEQLHQPCSRVDTVRNTSGCLACTWHSVRRHHDSRTRCTVVLKPIVEDGVRLLGHTKHGNQDQTKFHTRQRHRQAPSFQWWCLPIRIWTIVTSRLS